MSNFLSLSLVLVLVLSLSLVFSLDTKKAPTEVGAFEISI
jgi:hypothetical protein